MMSVLSLLFVLSLVALLSLSVEAGKKKKKCDGFCEKKVGHGSYCQYWKDHPTCYDPSYGYKKYECSKKCRTDCDSYCYYRTGDHRAACKKNHKGKFRCAGTHVKCHKKKCYSKYHRVLSQLMDIEQ